MAPANSSARSPLLSYTLLILILLLVSCVPSHPNKWSAHSISAFLAKQRRQSSDDSTAKIITARDVSTTTHRPASTHRGWTRYLARPPRTLEMPYARFRTQQRPCIPRILVAQHTHTRSTLRHDVVGHPLLLRRVHPVPGPFAAGCPKNN